MNILICHITNFYTWSLLKWKKKNAHINFLLINSGSMQLLTDKIKKINITIFYLFIIYYFNFKRCIMKQKLKN